VLRRPTADELATIAFLAEGSSDQGALSVQLTSLMVEPISDDPISLHLSVAQDAPAASVPEVLEGSGLDHAGTEVAVLLHLRDGRLSELEFYAPNGEEAYQRPEVGTLRRTKSIEWPPAN
jgi:hypothetical protein